METSTPRAKAEPAGLTAYVAEFITSTRYADIPGEVVQLGKKSILDGLGLALAGSVAKSGEIVRRHLQSLGCAGSASVLGSSMRVPARFAAFANGVAIHADDYRRHATGSRQGPGLRAAHAPHGAALPPRWRWPSARTQRCAN